MNSPTCKRVVLGHNFRSSRISPSSTQHPGSITVQKEGNPVRPDLQLWFWLPVFWQGGVHFHNHSLPIWHLSSCKHLSLAMHMQHQQSSCGVHALCHDMHAMRVACLAVCIGDTRIIESRYRDKLCLAMQACLLFQLTCSCLASVLSLIYQTCRQLWLTVVEGCMLMCAACMQSRRHYMRLAAMPLRGNGVSDHIASLAEV